MNIKKIATYTVCGIAALAAATQALPRHVNIERTAVMDAPADAVIALAASNNHGSKKTLTQNAAKGRFEPTVTVAAAETNDRVRSLKVHFARVEPCLVLFETVPGDV